MSALLLCVLYLFNVPASCSCFSHVGRVMESYQVLSKQIAEVTFTEKRFDADVVD